MRSKTGKHLRAAVLLAWAASISSVLANQPPVISAGVDAVVPINKAYSMGGTVEDDSTSLDSLRSAWTQISGPSQGEIYDAAASTTFITLRVTGSYVFALTVTDAQNLSSSDTVKLTARDTIPFEVLEPVNNQQIVKGQPFPIHWRNEGSAPCRVYLSFDDGLTEQMISTHATVDSMWYTIDTNLVDGTPGLVLIRYYPGAGPVNVVVSGSFVLVDHVDPPAKEKSGCGTGAGLALLPPLWFRVAGWRRRKSA